jgi:hypothetical protein
MWRFAEKKHRAKAFGCGVAEEHVYHCINHFERY